MSQQPVNVEVSTVHNAMNRAALAERNRVPLVNANFKLNPLHKESAEGVCEKNGTTLSAYLRECVSVLLLDYYGPKKAAELGIFPTQP